MAIKEHELQLLLIKELKKDADNPNELSEEQKEALRYSMKKFGNLEPIIVDQHKNIADGEHRVAIYEEFGKKQIPGFVVHCESDEERKLIRQAMNKIRGVHNSGLDAKEIQLLSEKGLLDELIKLTASRQEEIEILLSVNKSADELLKEFKEKHSAHLHISSTLSFYLSPEQRATIERALKATGELDSNVAIEKIASFYLECNVNGNTKA